MMEKIKSVPIPIWIGLGLILIVIFVLNNKSGGQAKQTTTTAPVGPVTTATVGTQGAQMGAGTDQELGNLSVMSQSGFAQIAQQNAAIAAKLGVNLNGGGTPMQQFGNAIQVSQNQSASDNAVNGTTGQNAGNNPSTITHPQ